MGLALGVRCGSRVAVDVKGVGRLMITVLHAPKDGRKARLHFEGPAEFKITGEHRIAREEAGNGRDATDAG